MCQKPRNAPVSYPGEVFDLCDPHYLVVGVQHGEESLPVLLVVVDPVEAARPEVDQQPVRSADGHVSVGG